MNRRDLLIGGPLSLAAIAEMSSALDGQTSEFTHMDREAAAFWVHGMGVPEHAIGAIAAERTRGGTLDISPSSNSFARQPVFLHYDDKAQSLVLADKIDSGRLLPSGDAQVDLQLQQLRLNPDDQRQFARYTSGGIYVELQQQNGKSSIGAAASAAGNVKSQGETPLLQLASSLFSAFMPHKAGSFGGKTGAGRTRGGASNFFAAQAGPGESVASTSAIPLQQANQRQSLALVNGLGKASIVAFVKDRQQTPFGQFISALVGTSSSPYAQLLSIPLMAVPALDGVRAVVASLQLGKSKKGTSDQQVVVQSPQASIAATAAALNAAEEDAVRFRTGSYVAVPQEHAAVLQGQLDKYMILKGCLVPKGTDELSLYKAAQDTLPDITYLSVQVNVKNAKLANCMA